MHCLFIHSFGWYSNFIRYTFYILFMGYCSTPLINSFTFGYVTQIWPQSHVERWHLSFHHAYQGIVKISLVEANVKAMTQWYMVPLCLSGLYQSFYPLCVPRLPLTWHHASYLVGVQRFLEQVCLNMKNFRDPGPPATSYCFVELTSWEFTSLLAMPDFLFKLSTAQSWKRTSVYVFI